MDELRSCRAILHAWREDPSYRFPARYHRYERLVRRLQDEPQAARLIDGIIVRIGRGDPPRDIDQWVDRFAERRNITLPAPLE